ncbi:DUF3857 domain-containing transglutaminase family protein [Serratia sp. UGAL515B_01]|uniref:DUF3857 domain-containing transglutaminase family protein n=1 Tax=Serratia sp. UGAL515B_01 TaxID=2986763 RepID=UPI002952F60A|nr:DUF3857 domain-containing transglutaminase family protein [Serratia sp. UGAL515B_01]WON78623.1 DUF3857 domain-containing transglutaminase family protein [Serratia sp. UGAL515B_01]
MLRFPFTLSLLTGSMLLVSTPLFASLQPVSEAPLSNETELRCKFNVDNSTDCVSRYTYTILKPSGREMLSRLNLNYAENDSMVVEKAELTQPGEKPVPLDKSQIDTRMAPNPDQGFLRERQTSFAFPNLRVGSRISYTVRSHISAKPFSPNFHYVLSFGPEPVRYDRFDAEYIAERPIFVRSEQMNTYHIEQSADKKSVKISLKAAPFYLNYINESNNGYLRNPPRVEMGSSLNLQDNFGLLAKRYNEILSATLPKGAAAAVAINKHKPAPEQVTAFMQYIYDNYRYLGDWRLSERGYIPFSLAEIERHGYGDCKDLAILLSAMLNASGIKAEPALVIRGKVAPSLLIPGVAAPNHVIVRAEVNGKTWWLDPTNPSFAPGRIMPDIQQRWALVLGADGQVRQDNIPLEKPALIIHVVKKDQFTADGNSKVTGSVDLSNSALMQLSANDRLHGRTSSDKGLCQYFANEVSECHLKRDESRFVLPASYRVTASLIDLSALDILRNQYIYSRDDLAEQWNELSKYRREGQLADLYIDDPQTLSYDIQLSGSKIVEPAHACKIRSPWFDIDMQAEPNSSGYHYRYREVQKVSWLSHSEINSEEFGKLIEQSRNCVEQLRMVVQKPA